MAKLFLAGSEKVKAERLYEALSERLPSHDVRVSNVDYTALNSYVEAIVHNDASIAIKVAAHPQADGTEFATLYVGGWRWLLMIPAIRQSRSPARYELEAEVIEAIRDKWPEISVQD